MISPVVIRVLIADSYQIYRLGVRSALERVSDFEVVAEAATAEETAGLWVTHRPDVTLVDVKLEHNDTGGVVGVIRKYWKEARVVILSDTAGDALARRALEAGAAGFIEKNISDEELRVAVMSVHHGRQFTADALANELAGRPTERELSRRELEVLKMVALGQSNKRIATKLGVTADTVKAHVKSVLSKLGAEDRTHAVVLAMRRGLINPFSQSLT